MVPVETAGFLSEIGKSFGFLPMLVVILIGAFLVGAWKALQILQMFLRDLIKSLGEIRDEVRGLRTDLEAEINKAPRIRRGS